MKKYLMVGIVTMAICHNLHAITMEAALNLLRTYAPLYAKDISDPSTAGQWENAFQQAKNFVEENSKNLVGSKDSDLNRALVDLQTAHDQLSDIISKIPRGDFRHLGEMPKLINTNIENTIKKLKQVKLTLSKKIQAQNVVYAMGYALQDIVRGINTAIGSKVSASGNPPARPTSNTPPLPYRPKPSPAPATPTPTPRALPPTPAPTSAGSSLVSETMKSEIWKIMDQNGILIPRLVGAMKGSVSDQAINKASLQQEFERILRTFNENFSQQLSFSSQQIRKPAINTIRALINEKFDINRFDPESVQIMNEALDAAAYTIFP